METRIDDTWDTREVDEYLCDVNHKVKFIKIVVLFLLVFAITASVCVYVGIQTTPNSVTHAWLPLPNGTPKKPS